MYVDRDLAHAPKTYIISSTMASEKWHMQASTSILLPNEARLHCE